MCMKSMIIFLVLLFSVLGQYSTSLASYGLTLPPTLSVKTSGTRLREGNFNPGLTIREAVHRNQESKMVGAPHTVMSLAS